MGHHPFRLKYTQRSWNILNCDFVNAACLAYPGQRVSRSPFPSWYYILPKISHHTRPKSISNIHRLRSSLYLERPCHSEAMATGLLCGEINSLPDSSHVHGGPFGATMLSIADDQAPRNQSSPYTPYLSPYSADCTHTDLENSPQPLDMCRSIISQTVKQKRKLGPYKDDHLRGKRPRHAKLTHV